MRKLLLVLAVFAISSAAWAQAGNSAWENVTALSPGQKIQVFDKSHGKLSGELISADAQNLKLHEKSGDTSLSRESVSRVSIPAPRGRHVILGLAIGAVAGAGIGAGTGGCSSGNCIGLTRGEAAGILAVVGGLGGAIVGALVPGHKTIYRAP